ncbi:MAG: helix-turn-helix domain-containing protein [Micrococcales bacterium]|nr:helix-turn-helix domain-containing protein [Micrococcales bacterium]
MSTLTLTTDTSDQEVLAFIHDRLAAGEHVQVTATEPFMTPQEVADSLAVSRAYIMTKIKAGEIVSTRRGNRHRISIGEVERFRNALVNQQWSLVADDVEAELFGDA